MIIENQNKEARLQFFSELYRSALESNTDIYEKFDRNMQQYKGSDEIDGSDERAVTVRNITYEIVESQVSSNIPMPKADPSSYSERKGRNAESIERLCRSIRDKLPFEELNDIDERYTYIYGGSVWYFEWDNEYSCANEIGGIKVHCISPKDFIPQPGIFSVEDMEFCFLRFTTTRGDLARRFSIKEEELDRLDCEYEYSSASPSIDAVSMIVCFYRDEDGDVGRFIFSGDLTLSDLPKYYMRKSIICKDCKREADDCVCGSKRRTKGEVLKEVTKSDISLDSGKRIPAKSPLIKDGVPVIENMRFVHKQTEIPYYVPSFFPIVIRKNTSGEKSLFGQSDCEYIRPQQQAINKIESRILQKLLRAGITPIVPEDARVTLNNSVFGQVIKMKPGESASQYGKVDTTPDISQDIAEAERLYDHAKRVVGISDAYQGIDTGSVAESGVAKQLRISQATGRLESKRRMKHTAYADMDKIIFRMYLAFADEPRSLSFKDSYGRIHSSSFNRYDFIERNQEDGSFYYDDDYLFSVDLNGGSEYQREAMWQRNLENLKAGTLGDPSSSVTLLRYWQCQERAHYPYARENVEYFTQAVDLEAKGVYDEEKSYIT